MPNKTEKPYVLRAAEFLYSNIIEIEPTLAISGVDTAENDFERPGGNNPSGKRISPTAYTGKLSPGYYPVIRFPVNWPKVQWDDSRTAGSDATLAARVQGGHRACRGGGDSQGKESLGDWLEIAHQSGSEHS